MFPLFMYLRSSHMYVYVGGGRLHPVNDSALLLHCSSERRQLLVSPGEAFSLLGDYVVPLSVGTWSSSLTKPESNLTALVRFVW